MEADASQYQQNIRAAVLKVQAQIRWKPGKELQHLQTRIEYGHLPSSATMLEYEAIIQHIIHDGNAEIFAYIWPNAVYATVVSYYMGNRWLVMFSFNGVMETAFPPTDPEEYLADSRFRYMSTLQELIT